MERKNLLGEVIQLDGGWHSATAKSLFFDSVHIHVHVYLYVYMCVYAWGNSVDRGAWTVHGATKSRTQLST